MFLQKLAIFNIYHVFDPFVKLRGCRFMYFLSKCDVRNEVVFLLLEHSSLRGVKQKSQGRYAGKSICQRDWSHRQHNKFYQKSCKQKEVKWYKFWTLKETKRLVLKFLCLSIRKVKLWIEQNILNYYYLYVRYM